MYIYIYIFKYIYAGRLGRQRGGLVGIGDRWMNSVIKGFYSVGFLVGNDDSRHANRVSAYITRRIMIHRVGIYVRWIDGQICECVSGCASGWLAGEVDSGTYQSHLPSNASTDPIILGMSSGTCGNEQRSTLLVQLLDNAFICTRYMYHDILCPVNATVKVNM